MWLGDLGPIEDPVTELIGDGIVTRTHVDAALAYPEEIQARIDLHHSETAAADARW